MAFRISTNTMASQAQRTLETQGREVQRSSAQIASGERITKAADDAAGLSISSGLRSEARGVAQAKRNAHDAISVVQVAEGGMTQVSNILIRMRELGVQSSSDTVSDTERSYINEEFEQLRNEINRISKTTRFGDQRLLDGSGQKYDFQVDSSGKTDGIRLDSSKLNSSAGALGINSFNLASKSGARQAISVLGDSLNRLNANRAELGAIQSRLTSAGDNLAVKQDSVNASASIVSDTDIAQSTAELTQKSIQQNAAVSMLAQANQVPQLALQLLN